MKPFLQEISEYFYSKYGEKTSDLIFVFPNKRAGIYFRYHLAAIFMKPVWSPAIHTISSFFQSLSRFQLTDRYSLIIDLYKAYTAVFESKGASFTETFDKFFFWGNMLLSDFDAIDKSLVNSKEIFTNLADLKNIEDHFDYLEPEQLEALKSFWNHLNVSRLSEEKSGFIKIWNVLADIYKLFNKNLSDSGFVYEGMIYSDVINNIKAGKEINIHSNLVFAGFNTLTKSETALFEYCRVNHGAVFFWDMEPFFLEKENSEMIRMLKQNLRVFPSPPDFQPARTAKENSFGKNIQIIGVSQEVGQAKAAAEKIIELQKNVKVNENETKPDAVILPAEYLLFPLINSLPETIPNVNITMGFPLRNTQLANLVLSILDLRKNRNVKASGLYYTDVTAILRHPWIYQSAAEQISPFLDDIIRFNRVYVSETRLKGISSLTDLIFLNKDPLPDFLKDVLFALYKNVDISVGIEKEYIYRFYTEINRIREILTEKNFTVDEEILISLIRDIVKTIRIPFSGEPLSGLQIMGILETRCLDFNNLFILSMNEGKWPPASGVNSYIPHSLRLAFGLPTYKDQEAIYSYNFYRLLQRSENVFLFYNTETGYNGEGEKSRYLNQLKYDFKFDIRESVWKLPVKPAPTKEITLPVSGFSESVLKQYLTGSKNQFRLTPTAINTYLDCRLQFYLKYISLLKEPEKVEEIDPATFGTLLHSTLEIFYRKISENGQKPIQADDFNHLGSMPEEAVSMAFSKFYNLEDTEFEFEGNNLLVRNILLKYTKEILKTDSEYAPFELLSLERPGDYLFDLELTNHQKIGLKGTIDRIDQKDHVIRILDYKTGRTEKKIAGLESLFDRDNPNRNKAGFQLLFYSMLYLSEKKALKERVVPAIYNIRSMFSDNFDFRLYIKKGQEPETYIDNVVVWIPPFSEQLKFVLDELFNPKNSFDQTENEATCKYCPYKSICVR